MTASSDLAAHAYFATCHPAFAEDPVRILRVARFVARFARLHRRAGNPALMRAMVEDGEVDELVPSASGRRWTRRCCEATP